MAWEYFYLTMSDRTLKLLLVDDDPIFRLGLRTWLQAFPDLEVVADTEPGDQVWQLLSVGEFNPGATTPEQDLIPGDRLDTDPISPNIDLLLLSLSSSSFDANQFPELLFYQQLKLLYPHLPVLLLSAIPDPALLAAAQAAGINGYWPKSAPGSTLITAIHQIAAGETYFEIQGFSVNQKPPRNTESQTTQLTPSQPLPTPPNLNVSRSRRTSAPTRFWGKLRTQMRASAQRQIDQALMDLKQQLQNSQLSELDRFVIYGHRRELRAARWLIEQLLAPLESETPSTPVSPGMNLSDRLPTVNPKNQPGADPSVLSEDESNLPVSIQANQSALFDATLAKLQSYLPNLTDVPLEIDILRPDKKQELLYIILRKFEEILDEMRLFQVQLEQVPQKRITILQDLWESSITEFFGKYYTVDIGNRRIEVVPILLADIAFISEEILNKIPLSVELFNHFLFQASLRVENIFYPAGTPQAMAQAEILLQNLVIQVANAVVQPLLNHFADLEEIKENFYDRRWLSTREIERFRNNLSWKYRQEKYLGEPKAMFESRFWVFRLDFRGIRKISIYAPRRQELVQLSGIPLAVTLILETRDAIAPRVRSAISFVGAGVVYLLTQVIGKGIGLIGKGIVQGIGTSWQDVRSGKNSDRQNQ